MEDCMDYEGVIIEESLIDTSIKNYKNMRSYKHEEFISMISKMNERELIEFSSKYGGYPVLFRMALDERVSNIPFIQTGSAVIVENENGEILLQERSDNGKWGLPGGCQEIGEKLENTAVRELFEETGIKIDTNDLVLIDTVSGPTRKNVYPNGDICYNNTSLYLVKVQNSELLKLSMNPESKQLKFFKLNELPENNMDEDLIEKYLEKLDKN
jgi:8-oxo-dGTP pyrophosphatase MutT (NUDIX family)